MLKVKSNVVDLIIEHRTVEFETSKGILKIEYSTSDDMEWQSTDDTNNVLGQLSEDEDDELYQKMDELQSSEIKKENKSIRIPVTDNDIEELRDGGSFDWSFPVEGSADSEWIDVELVNDNEEPL